MLVVTLEAGKENDSVGLLLHKGKNSEVLMDLPLYHSWVLSRNGFG